MRRPIEPREQRDSIAGTTWEWRGGRAATRDDQREMQIECCACEPVDGDQRESTRKINVGRGGASTCNQNIERGFVARTGHGAGVASGSCTTAPSMEMRARVR